MNGGRVRLYQVLNIYYNYGYTTSSQRTITRTATMTLTENIVLVVKSFEHYSLKFLLLLKTPQGL